MSHILMSHEPQGIYIAFLIPVDLSPDLSKFLIFSASSVEIEIFKSDSPSLDGSLDEERSRDLSNV